MTEIHTTEAKLTCDWPGCDSAFSSHNKLRIHKMKHTGEKPYKCSQCEWRFRQKNHLKTHLLKHSGEKPFSCQHCDRRFEFRAKSALIDD
ncbi:unnamed protein product [Medioppia subpectinata]|uniref:C2H2-type domain-containing protein n=1 Tax=Medioppia subpectinata TaxID=1979941 RepID=A0A7R9LSJ5_9ACAR|nr:unnamed protein product [Medioppia subpectinata]CAG2120807.1 unnamed protein product [Medioppia subpectinata]